MGSWESTCEVWALSYPHNIHDDMRQKRFQAGLMQKRTIMLTYNGHRGVSTLLTRCTTSSCQHSMDSTWCMLNLAPSKIYLKH